MSSRETLRRGRRVDDAEGLTDVVGLRCGGFRWGRLPIIGEIILLGLRRRPAASCGCPAVLKVKRRALGGFSRVLASLFSEPRDEYVHFSKTYL